MAVTKLKATAGLINNSSVEFTKCRFIHQVDPDWQSLNWSNDASIVITTMAVPVNSKHETAAQTKFWSDLFAV